MKLARKLLAVTLALVLALGMAGCNSNDTSWVYSYDGEDMPAGVYIYYMLSAFYDGYNALLEAENEKMEAAADNEEIEYDYEAYSAIAYGSADELLKMSVDGVPMDDWMIRRTGEYVRQYYAAKELAAQYGVSLDEAAQGSVNSLVSAMVQNNAEYYDRNGIAESSVYLQFEAEELKQQLFEHLYDNGGEYAMAEDELIAALNDEYAKAQWLEFPKASAEDEDADTLNAQAKSKAELALGRLNDGEAIEDLYLENALEEAMADGGEGGVLNQPAAGDLDHIITKGYTYSVYEYELTGSYVSIASAISEGVFEQAAGTPVLLEDDNAYYVVRRLDITAGSEFEGLRGTVLRELKYEEYTDMLEAYGATLDLRANEAAVKRYNVKFLDLG